MTDVMSRETIERLQREGFARIDAAADVRALEEVRVELLGRKGRITSLLRALKDVPDSDRPALGAALNETKRTLTERLEQRQAGLSATGPSSQRSLDLTLPGQPPAPLGVAHPLVAVVEEICEIFYGMGFDRDDGPDVELDYYNFAALNFPDDHPARDIQDTFYVDDQLLLRTQTSPVQVRLMERVQPPLSYVFPGRVYRNEAVDASHSAEFFQIEGLSVDRNVTMADLRDAVEAFVSAFFGPGRPTRFRPHYFPFTEPSAEVDMQCFLCRGAGCGVCGQTGWLEIMGAGMVHPEVFRHAGYPADAYTGFAFGMGIDRIAMLRYGIDDIRLLYENDLRFLHQFRGMP
ncbi:MAG: phenylalanine--tRNA ligase subunit alpha [Candidatus Krumholzibacteriia bacterium]